MVMINLYPLAGGYLFSIIKLFALVLLAAVLFTSCTVAKPTYIFKDIIKDTVIRNFADTDVELKIKKNDILSLSISSLNPVEDMIFNGATGPGVSGGSLSSKTEGNSGGYLVSLDGNIYLHKLGTVMVAGYTRKQLKVKIEQELLPYLKDPIVTVNFANHFITVMGAVGNSQVINMPAEKISLIDAIALSGNVSLDGTLRNVLVIRETPTSKEFKHLNLENQSIFTSPWYYLQPKDIVVINPNEEKLHKEQKRTRNQQIISTVLSGLSIAIIILDRIFR